MIMSLEIGKYLAAQASHATRFVTRDAILSMVKSVFPDAYLDGDSIILPTKPSDWKDGDVYELQLITTKSYKA